MVGETEKKEGRRLYCTAKRETNMLPNDGSFLSRMLALKQGTATSSAVPLQSHFPQSPSSSPSLPSSAPLPTSKRPVKTVTLLTNRVFLEDQYDGFRWSDEPLKSSSTSSRNFKQSVSSPVEFQPPSSFLPWSSTIPPSVSLHSLQRVAVVKRDGGCRHVVHAAVPASAVQAIGVHVAREHKRGGRSNSCRGRC